MKSIEEIQLPPRDRAAITEATRLLHARFPVEQVILFGSKARGDYDEESDIDILILTSRSLSRAERYAISDALFPLQLRHDVVLSPLIVPAEEWESGIVSALPIHEEILEQGATA
ncbi:MAG: nucleotidyltransferase domain-containing protein [Acidobacteriota bacterium]